MNSKQWNSYEEKNCCIFQISKTSKYRKILKNFENIIKVKINNENEFFFVLARKIVFMKLYKKEEEENLKKKINK